MLNALRLTFITGCAILALASPARADEIPAAAQAFLDTLGEMFTLEPDYDSVTTGPDGRIIITNLSYGGDAFTAEAERVELDSVTDRGDGLFEIGAVALDNVSFEVELPGLEMPITFEAPAAEAKSWFVWRLGPDATMQQRLRANAIGPKTMAADDMTLSMNGFDFHVARYEGTWAGDPATGTGHSFAKLSNMEAPAELIRNAPADSPVKQMGYETLAFDISMTTDFGMKDDTFDLAMQLSIAGRDIGALSVSAGAKSIPFSAMEEIERADEAGEEPDFSEIAPELEKASFAGAEIRFDDSSITRKVIALAAAEQGVSEDTVISMAGPMVQMALAYLNAPDFSSKAAAAVEAFLKDPRSIALVAEPATPVTGTDFMTLDPDALGEALERLGAAIVANAS